MRGLRSADSIPDAYSPYSVLQSRVHRYFSKIYTILSAARRPTDRVYMKNEKNRVFCWLRVKSRLATGIVKYRWTRPIQVPDGQTSAFAPGYWVVRVHHAGMPLEEITQIGNTQLIFVWCRPLFIPCCEKGALELSKIMGVRTHCNISCFHTPLSTINFSPKLRSTLETPCCLNAMLIIKLMKHQMRGGNFLAIFCATNIEYNCSNYFPTAHTHTHTHPFSTWDFG